MSQNKEPNICQILLSLAVARSEEEKAKYQKAFGDMVGASLDRQAREKLMSAYGGAEPTDFSKQNGGLDLNLRKYLNEKA